LNISCQIHPTNVSLQKHLNKHSMKAIAYIRVSTTNQDIKRQSVKINEYCSSNNYELVEEIVDFGVSGATFERAGFKRLNEINLENADIVVISELSRLSRKEDILDTLNAVNTIIVKGLKLLFLDNPSKIYAGSLDIMEVVMLSVGAYGAAQERLAIKRRNVEGKTVLFNSNPYAVVDGRTPYGFKKITNPSGTHPKYLLQVDEKESLIVQKIFNLVMEGNSVAFVMHYLHNTGIRHNTDVIFTKQNLSKLYSNEIYKGVRLRNKLVANIEAIIEPQIWNEVQLKIKENHNFGSTGTTMFNPLRGIIKCRCGRAMMVKSKGDGVFVFRCSDVKPKYMPNCCEYIDSIRFDLTNEIIFSLLKNIDFVQVKGKFDDKILDLTTQYEGINHQIEVHSRQIKLLNIEIEQQQEKYLNTTVKSLLSKIQERIISLETDVTDINKLISKKSKQVISMKNNIKNIIDVSKDENFDNLDIKERAIIFRKYIKEINYLPVTTMQGFYRVIYTSGIESIVAIKKTGNSPIFAVLPDTFELNTNLTIKTTDLEEITLSDFFKKHSSKYILPVDLSYRNN